MAVNLPGERSTSRHWLHLAAIPLLWFAAGLALTIDMWVVQFWRTSKTPAFIVDVLESAETFGNGAGVVLLLILVLALQAVPRRALIRMATVSLGSGLLADFFKLLVARTRPRDLTIEQGVLETFCGWFSPSTASSAMHSFPSAHVATAVGFAFALSYYFPRGRYVFVSLVCLVLVQRLQTGAHFVSDTLVGAALGLGPAFLFFKVRKVADWFDQFEQGTAAVSLVNPRVPTHHFSSPS
jgi:membrane-associated phospholipid phosphatase